MSDQAWVKVGTVAEFEESCPRGFEVSGKELVVCRIGEEFFSAAGTCTHAEFPLSDADVDDCILTCPLHGAQFDIRTGEVMAPPADDPLPTYPTRVENGDVYVRPGD